MKIFTQRECTMVAPPAALKIFGRAGFTLIELSIVLIIVGLIIGGVLVGRDLIHAAELRKQMNQFGQYEVAVQTFRIKYGCEPGRCANGVALGVGADAPQSQPLFMQPLHECDDSPDGSDCPSMITESIFFTNLRAAGLITDVCIDNNFHQQARLAGTNLTLNANVQSLDIVLSSWDQFPANGNPNKPAVTALDAQYIDQKMDDGMPDSGKLTANGMQDWGNSHDTDSGSPTYDAGPAGDPVCVTTDFTPYRYNTSYTGGKTCKLGLAVLY